MLEDEPERADNGWRSIREPSQDEPDNQQGVVDIQEIRYASGHHKPRHRVATGQNRGEVVTRKRDHIPRVPAVNLK